MRRPSSSPLLPPPPLLSNIIIIRIVKRKITCQRNKKKKRWGEKLLSGVSIFPQTSNPSFPFPHSYHHFHSHTSFQTTWIWEGLIISLQYPSECLLIRGCIFSFYSFFAASMCSETVFAGVCVCVSPLLNANQWVAQAERLSNPIAAPLCPSTPRMQCSKADRYGVRAVRCCGWLVMLLAHNLLINFLLSSLSITSVSRWEVCLSVTAEYFCVCKYVLLPVQQFISLLFTCLYGFSLCFRPFLSCLFCLRLCISNLGVSAGEFSAVLYFPPSSVLHYCCHSYSVTQQQESIEIYDIKKRYFFIRILF